MQAATSPILFVLNIVMFSQQHVCLDLFAAQIKRYAIVRENTAERQCNTITQLGKAIR